MSDFVKPLHNGLEGVLSINLVGWDVYDMVRGFIALDYIKTL